MSDLPTSDPSLLTPIQKLTKDLREAARTLGPAEARFLVDAYYKIQEDRIRSAHQVRTLSETTDDKAPEPHDTIAWLFTQEQTLENQIRRALDAYSGSQPAGVWLRCAPPGSLVAVGGGRWITRRQVPIEDLRDGDGVASFNRHHATMTSPRPISVGQRHYCGDLIGIEAASLLTETTPNHMWLVRLNKREGGHSVYLMRSGSRYRVGRCELFIKGGKDRLRLGIQRRAWREHADVWILKMFSTDREAAVYEQFISTQYGLSEWPFRPPLSNRLIQIGETDAMFAMLDAARQRARAERCLIDHDRLPDYPLYSWSGDQMKQSGTQSIKTAAANLIPEIMGVPLPLRRGTIDWQPITNLPRRDYDGPVYSLDVEQHHTYVQDGMVTCNSITGIGPVIAAGLLAHIDISRAPTVGHIWRYAGLDPTVSWDKGTKRPWNGALKRLCWIVGESFTKVSNNPNDTYGKLYQQRKEREIQRNEAGDYAEQAAASLAAKRFGDDTQAKKHYLDGKLPPARIHLRAQRWAVKIFLSHFHEVLFFVTYGERPVKPYVLDHVGGHVHRIEVPNAHMVPGLKP